LSWQISKKGFKLFSVIFIFIFTFTPLILTTICASIFIGEPTIKEIVIIILTSIIAFLPLFILFCYLGKVSYNWDNPTIVRIDDDNGYVMVKEEYPDGYVTENRIYFDSIYKIEIKSDKDAAIYYTRKGVRYRWHIVRRSLTKEERAVSFQILEEIIKRVDRNKVEIVDLRKR